MKHKLIIVSFLFSILSFNNNGEFGFNKINAQCLNKLSRCYSQYELCHFYKIFNSFNNYLAINSIDGELFSNQTTDNNIDESWAIIDLDASLTDFRKTGGPTFRDFLSIYGDPFYGAYTPDEIISLTVYYYFKNFSPESYIPLSQTPINPEPCGF